MKKILKEHKELNDEEMKAQILEEKIQELGYAVTFETFEQFKQAYETLVNAQHKKYTVRDGG